MILFKKDSNIEFYCFEDVEHMLRGAPEPKAASKYIPDWFKKVKPQMSDSRDHFGGEMLTVKKCLPVLDSMCLGYIIPMQADCSIVTNYNLSHMEIVGNPRLHSMEFHTVDQVGGSTYPGFPGKPVKFINNWVIKTAPGWSVMITSPMNHFNPDFTCFSAVVDTDRYPKQINFPAMWHTPNFDGVIRAGTPLVQVIPFKRKSFPKNPKIRKITKKERKLISDMTDIQHCRNHYYTQELREEDR